MKTLQSRDEATHTREVHRKALDVSPPSESWRKGLVRGVWAPTPTVSASVLAAAVEQLEKSPLTRHIKETPRSNVMLGELFGSQVIVKRYASQDTASKLKSLFRPSAGHRAWAASNTFAELGLPTPEALGYLERASGRHVEVSYFITRFISDAEPARNWIKPQYHRQSAEIKSSFRSALLNHILKLYRLGVCHGDLKSLNILLQNPTDEEKRSFYWIDLDSTQFGTRPNRHHIIRNLVQLNGSLGSKVSDADRMAFLEEMSGTYPWVTNPRVVARIRKWTKRRLARELNRICGP